MLVHKVKLIALTLLFAGVIAAGTGYVNLALSIQAEQAIELPAAPAPQFDCANGRKGSRNQPGPHRRAGPTDQGRMTVVRPRARSGRQACGRRAASISSVARALRGWRTTKR